MQHGHKEPCKYNTPKEQVAERVNLIESRRLTQQSRYYMLQKQNAEHLMNQKIDRVRGVLDHIALSSGNLAGQEFIKNDATAPCFMYGERVESRRRYSKRMALLRYFLERRPKSPQGLGRASALAGRKQEVDTRSADEIFQEILSKIETDSEEEDDREVDKEPVPKSSKQKRVKARSGSAVTGSASNRLSPTRGGGRKPRPRTAPCWESKPSLLPGGNPKWTTSTSSIQDLVSMSPRLQVLLEDSGLSANQRDAYIPFWADMDPVNRSELRSSRGKSQSIVSSTSSIQGAPRYEQDALRQPSTSSVSSLYSSSSGRTRTKHRSISSPSSSRRNNEQLLRVDAYFSPQSKSSGSSCRTQKTVDSFFNSSDNPESLSDDLENLVLPSLPTEHNHSFKRPTIYAPTIASRQRTISSMLVSAGTRRSSISS